MANYRYIYTWIILNVNDVNKYTYLSTTTFSIISQCCIWFIQNRMEKLIFNRISVKIKKSLIDIEMKIISHFFNWRVGNIFRICSSCNSFDGIFYFISQFYLYLNNDNIKCLHFSIWYAILKNNCYCFYAMKSYFHGIHAWMYHIFIKTIC